MERNHRCGAAVDEGAARGEPGLGPGQQTQTEQLIWADEEPRLVDSTSDEMKGRDRAIKKWNDVVATPGSGIDKVPGK